MFPQKEKEYDASLKIKQQKIELPPFQLCGRDWIGTMFKKERKIFETYDHNHVTTFKICVVIRLLKPVILNIQ